MEEMITKIRLFVTQKQKLENSGDGFWKMLINKMISFFQTNLQLKS